MNWCPPTPSTLLLLALSLGVLLLFRCLKVISPKGSGTPTVVTPSEWFGLGVQDAFAGSVIALLAAGLGMAFKGPVAVAVVVTCFIVFFQAVVAADHFIQRQTGLRFAWHFLSYLRLIRRFARSAQQGGMGLAKFGILFGFYAAFSVTAMGLAFAQWGVPRIEYSMIGMVVGLGLASLVVQALLSAAVLAERQNIWLVLVRAVLSRRFRPTGGAAVDVQDLIRRVSPGERYTALDVARPLLRLTHGYEGPRQIELDLRGERPHVLLLFMESFCASTIGVLGEDVGASPEFDRLAGEGVLFKNFYANGVQTARAMISGLFGIPPRFTERPAQSDQHGCPRLIGLPQFFGGLGYHTAYLHNGSLAFEGADQFCRRQGFHELCGEDDLQVRFPEARNVGGWGLPDEYLMRHCADWVAQRESSGTPGFATLFTMTNHHPFEVPDGYVPPSFCFPGNPEKEEFLRTFAYSDACLGLLIRLLRERDLYQKCVLFILGDTAQPLGEHDNWGVQVGMYEENFRIPLLILAPRSLRGPVVISNPSSQMDLLPTFIDLFGQPFAHHATGTSLLRVTGQRPIWFNNPFGLAPVGQRLGPLKVVHETQSGVSKLYDLLADPSEQHDLAARGDDRARILSADLLATHSLVQDLYARDRFC